LGSFWGFGAVAFCLQRGESVSQQVIKIRQACSTSLEGQASLSSASATSRRLHAGRYSTAA